MEHASSWQIHAEVHRDLKLLLSSSSNACVCTDLVATQSVRAKMGEDASHLFNLVLEVGASSDLDYTGHTAWSHFMVLGGCFQFFLVV